MPKLTNPRHEKFAWLYYAGPEETRGNATAAYAEAFSREKDRTSRANGSRLLAKDSVRARIEEIRQEAAEDARLRAREWWSMVPEAQRTLLQAITGEWPEKFDGDDQAKRSAVEAAREILNRAEGLPQQMHEHRHSHQLVAVVAGPDQSDAEAIEDGSSDPRLSSGPRYIEAASK